MILQALVVVHHAKEGITTSATTAALADATPEAITLSMPLSPSCTNDMRSSTSGAFFLFRVLRRRPQLVSPLACTIFLQPRLNGMLAEGEHQLRHQNADSEAYCSKSN